MDLKEHFVNEELVEFEIDGGKFTYKPVTAGEENEWLGEYMVEKNGKLVQDITALNKCKIRNLVSVPYDRQVIENLIKLNKDWKELTNDQKWLVISKLKPTVLSMVISEITKIDNPKKKES